jgi:hypothetical protein
MRLFRFKLKTLLVATTLIAIVVAYYGHVTSEISSEKRTLKTLKENGAITSGKYGNFIAESEVNRVKAFFDWPVYKFFDMDDVIVWRQGIVLKDADYLRQLSNLKYLAKLNVETDFRAEDLAALRKLKHLRSIEFLGFAPIQNDQLDAIIKMKSLRIAKFGSDKLTVGQFEQLTNAGIIVFHTGLSDYRLKENYYAFLGKYYPLDLTRSELLITADRNDQFRCSIRINTRDSSYTPSGLKFFPSFYSKPIPLANGWRKLVGTKLEFNLVPEEYDYISSPHSSSTSSSRFRISDFKVEILSQVGNKFHVKWQFYTVDGNIGYVNAWLPMRKTKIVNLTVPDPKNKFQDLE